MEWNMWYVAPLSIIHSFHVRLGGATRLEEKTEWSRLMEEVRHKCVGESILALLGKLDE